MTDIDYDSPAEEPQEPHALQAQALQTSVEPYPCANVIAQMTHWVLESTRFGYEDVRRWECILRYFRLMNDHQILFTYYGNIRVTVIAKISEIQEYIMEDSDFVVENRSLFTLLHYVMNDVMSVICRVDPPEMRGDRRRKRTHGCAFSYGDTSHASQTHTPLL
jgi:hypothetical protein